MHALKFSNKNSGNLNQYGLFQSGTQGAKGSEQGAHDIKKLCS